MPTYTFMFENGKAVTVEDETIFQAWQQCGLPGEEFQYLEFCRETTEKGSDIIGAARFEQDFYTWLDSQRGHSSIGKRIVNNGLKESLEKSGKGFIPGKTCGIY